MRSRIKSRLALCIGLLAPALSLADGEYFLTPLQDAVVMNHPLFGEMPAVTKQAYFASQNGNELEVSLRMTAVEKNGKGVTSLIIMIKNTSSDTDTIVNPILDLIDGNGLVRRVMDFQQLMTSARAATAPAQQSGGFFAFGSQQFVGAAIGGYAIGSVLKEISDASRREKISTTARMLEKHWLKTEYRIPPSSHVDGMVLLSGLPELPLKARITINDKEFVFSSVSSMSEAENSYKLSKIDR